MLKLKKIVPQQVKITKSAQKTKSLSKLETNTKQSIQNIQLISQQVYNQQLKKILSDFQNHKDLKRILQILEKENSSIQADLFALILQTILNTINEKTYKLCVEILKKLISISHDQKELKLIFKSSKIKIDPVTMLIVLWRYRNFSQLWKYVQYMIECYPTDLRLNGKQYLEMWRQYISQRNILLKLQQQIRSQSLNQEIKRKIKQNENKRGYQDIQIEL